MGLAHLCRLRMCLSSQVSAWPAVTCQVGVMELMSLEAHHLRLHHVKGVAAVPHTHAHTRKHTRICTRTHTRANTIVSWHMHART